MKHSLQFLAHRFVNTANAEQLDCCIHVPSEVDKSQLILPKDMFTYLKQASDLPSGDRVLTIPGQVCLFDQALELALWIDVVQM